MVIVGLAGQGAGGISIFFVTELRGMVPLQPEREPRFVNLFAGPQSPEIFPSSPHPSGSRQNAASTSPSGGRTIVQADDIPFGVLI